MTLFQECKEALSEDFQIVNEALAYDVLKAYLTDFGCINWDWIRYTDYDNYELLLQDLNINSSCKVFVFTDDKEIPVFKSNLGLVMRNIYDVMALCPRVYIFNEDIILQPLFPTYTIRVGGSCLAKIVDK